MSAAESPALIDVVSAVIVKDGRLLLTQRRADKDFPFLWETPGGAVDGGEAYDLALRRELAEELGIQVEIPPTARALWKGEFRNPVGRKERAHVFVLLYAVDLPPGQVPRPMEGQGIGWFSVSELAGLRLTPANTESLGRVIARMAGQR